MFERVIYNIGKDTEVLSKGDGIMLDKFLITDNLSSDDSLRTLKAQCF